MNMSNMIGIGPFLTIPLILKAMNGPQAMLGWVLGALLAVCDGMVWAELASTVPCSGGTLEYLKTAYAGTRLGRLLPFLFIWQFILSGPLEIASGAIGFAQYAKYLLPQSWLVQLPVLERLMPWLVQAVAVGVVALSAVLLYRKIESVAKLVVGMWIGVLVTVGCRAGCRCAHFSPAAVFDFPPKTFSFSQGFLLGLGSAMMYAMYDYLGYYSICYVGDEVRLPRTTMPRSILISVVAVAAIYLLMNATIISVVPWREAARSDYIATEFMERLHGPAWGAVMTVLVCWTAFASVFTLMMAYSRIPFAAARDGYFFSAFARLHPRGDFPHVSLLVLGAVSAVASFFSLDAVISVFVASRILVQFIAQVAAASRLRGIRAENPGFRMMFYPLPSLLVLIGWTYIFMTTDAIYGDFAIAMLAAGAAAFCVWSRIMGRPARQIPPTGR